MDTIRIRGARTHNLKNIDVYIPRDKLVVITGLSGSGKSSIAFDTIYAEGQRRYVESLSAYARQFLSIMEKPDVDLIEGLSPAIWTITTRASSQISRVRMTPCYRESTDSETKQPQQKPPIRNRMPAIGNHQLETNRP